MPKRWTPIIIPIAFIVLGILLFLTVDTEAKTIEVDIEGNEDYTSIQDGVNASKNGDVVVIHEGEYHGRVNITTSITLKSAEDERVVLSNSIENISFSIGAKNLTITNLHFQESNSGIQLFNCSGIIIKNCTFNDCTMGISIISSSYVLITNNIFSNNTYTGIFYLTWKGTDVCKDNRIFDNIFSKNRNGIIMASLCTEINVHDNRFENNSNSGITCVSYEGVTINATNNWWGSPLGPYNYEDNPFGRGDTVIGPVTFDPWIGKENIPPFMNLSDVYVLGSVTENGDGSQENPFDSIMQAIYHTMPNGTIHVWEGVYFEHLVIERSMRIIGNGSEVTIIESGGFGDCVVVLANHVEIRNIQISVISNQSLSLDLFGKYPLRNSCLRIESSNNTIANCTITDGVVGIDLFHSSNNTISSNTFHPHSGSYHEEGIVLQDGSNDNTIIGNTIHDFYYFGISVSSSVGNIIERNDCTKNEIGISLSGCDRTVLNGNDCSNNSEIGIRIQKSSHLLISNNSCNNNGEVGIELDRGSGDGDRCVENELTSNDCSGNGLAGIDLGSSSRSVLKMNSMHDSGITFGSTPREFQDDHDIDETNMVNGKPVVYLSRKAGVRVDGEAGQVILVNCSDIVVENQQLDSCTIGIALYFCESITISNSSFSDNVFGILMHGSDNNHLFNNTLTDNNRDIVSGGLHIFFSHNNTIANNTISGNDVAGMGFVLSSNNSISNNTITGNGYGIIFLSNQVFFKNFRVYLREDDYSYGINRVNYNSINGNAHYGISVDEISSLGPVFSNDDNSYRVDARYNWWGNDGGPIPSEKWRNPDGKGDRVSDHVEFSPWITEDGSLRFARSDDDDRFFDILHPLDLMFLLVSLVLLFAILVLVVRSPDDRFK